MEPVRTSAPLQREVLPPQTREHGFGVLLVASTAMFLAVMSSAFALHARAVRRCPGSALHGEAYAPTPVVGVTIDIEGQGIDLIDTPDVQAPEPCDQPAYRENPDGSVSVFFRLCPDGVIEDLTARPLDLINAVEVAPGR